MEIVWKCPDCMSRSVTTQDSGPIPVCAICSAIDAALTKAYQMGKEDERKDAIAFLEFSPAHEILPVFRARSI